MTRPSSWALAAASRGPAAACAVGPNYERPSAPFPPPTRSRRRPGRGPTDWKPAEPRTRPRGRWWEVFGDPGAERARGAGLRLEPEHRAGPRLSFAAPARGARGPGRVPAHPHRGGRRHPFAQREPSSNGTVIGSGSSRTTTTSSRSTSRRRSTSGAASAGTSSRASRRRRRARPTSSRSGSPCTPELAADYFLLRGLDADGSSWTKR